MFKTNFVFVQILFLITITNSSTFTENLKAIRETIKPQEFTFKESSAIYKITEGSDIEFYLHGTVHKPMNLQWSLEDILDKSDILFAESDLYQTQIDTQKTIEDDIFKLQYILENTDPSNPDIPKMNETKNMFQEELKKFNFQTDHIIDLYVGKYFALQNKPRKFLDPPVEILASFPQDNTIVKEIPNVSIETFTKISHILVEMTSLCYKFHDFDTFQKLDELWQKHMTFTDETHLNARNMYWLKNLDLMENIFNSKNNVFISVGHAHLPGLLQEFQKIGFSIKTVEPTKKEILENDFQEKMKILLEQFDNALLE